MHEGSGLGHSVEDVKRACPNAEVRNAVAFPGSSIDAAKDKVKRWIEKCGV